MIFIELRSYPELIKEKKKKRFSHSLHAATKGNASCARLGRRWERGRPPPEKTHTQKLGIGLFSLLLPLVGRWKMQDGARGGRQRPNRTENTYIKKIEDRLKEKPSLLEGTRNSVDAGEKWEV